MQKKDISIANSQRLGPLLYRGSVKSVRGLVDDPEVLFEYSDRYSVFDWGEMPDLLPQKGMALAVMTDAIYQKLGAPWRDWKAPFAALKNSPVLTSLQKDGLAHHGIGLVGEDGKVSSAVKLSSLWKVKACRRELPEFKNGSWDYSWYRSAEAQAIAYPVLIPLEVVFRFGAPQGSSFLKRCDQAYAQELGFTSPPKPGEWFSNPIVEYFTKLEPSDRFVTRREAIELAGLSQKEEKNLHDLALLIACRVRDLFASIGLSLWDGKFEFAFLPGRSICLVDAIGPDELRLLSAEGFHVSKELLRQYYRNSKWYGAVEEAKKLAAKEGREDWKSLYAEKFGIQPEALPTEVRDAVAEIYKATANALVGEKRFSGVKELRELLTELPASLRGPGV